MPRKPKIKNIFFEYNKYVIGYDEDNNVISANGPSAEKVNNLLNSSFILEYDIESFSKSIFEFKDINRRNKIIDFTIKNPNYHYFEKIIVDYLLSKNVNPKKCEIILQRYIILLIYYDIVYVRNNNIKISEFDELLNKGFKIDNNLDRIDNQIYDMINILNT